MSDSKSPLIARDFSAIEWRDAGQNVFVDSEFDRLTKARLYRYASIGEALAICKGQLSLVSPALWTDKYEAYLSERSLTTKSGALARCFSLDYSSEALWRIYGKSGGAIRLGFSASKFVETLQKAKWPDGGKIYIGRVRYLTAAKIRAWLSSSKNAMNDPSASAAVDALLLKRTGFYFENEVRVIFVPPPKAKVALALSVSGLPVERVLRVLVDPYLPGWQAKELIKVFESIDRLKCPVEQSVFDLDPHGLV